MLRVTRSTVIDAPIARVWEVLRDFNSHTAWHAVVAQSVIENGEPSDQIGCVRNFTLKDGNHIREQLLTLDDREFKSTYCIVEASVPLQRYVATITLKPVTDGNRTKPVSPLVTVDTSASLVSMAKATSATSRT